MKLKEITEYLESLAPLSFQEQYDNSGLIVGNPEKEINKALICIDCTEEVIDESISNRCDLIISHHPLIFEGLKKITGYNYTERAVIKAIKQDIAIYSIHTNFDNIIDGVNRKIAEVIGLKNCKILSPKKNLLKKLVTFCPVAQAKEVRQAIFSAGAGVIGNYDECSYNTEGYGTFRACKGAIPYVGEIDKQHSEPEIRIETIYPVYKEPEILKALFKAHPYEEVAYDLYPLENEFARVGAGIIGELKKEENTLDFLKKIKTKFQTDCIRHTRIIKEKVKSIAICGGAGVFLLSEAIKNDMDIFITSDLKYHQFFDADDKIIIADIGHYESEQFTKNFLIDLLNKKFFNFAFQISKINTNPIKYL